MTELIQFEAGGELRKCGLLAPPSPPNLFARLGDAIPLLSEPEIRRILDDPDRVSGRKRFGPDWIKDQNGRGACQGYGQAAIVERARVRRGLPHVKLSGDYAYACVNGGNDNGSMLDRGMASAGTNGTCSEEIVKKHGLTHEYRKSRFPAECDADAKRFVGFEMYHVDTEQELLTACALGYDCVVAVQAGGSSDLDRYGVVGWGNGMGNHAVAVDDAVYDTQMGGYKFDDPNSWSTRWGDQGRCYLTWNRHFRQSVSVHRFYAIRSTGDDSQGEQPPAPKS